MNVSFTGINNFKIGRKKSHAPVIYKNNNDEIKQEMANITEIKLRFDLTNDEKGRDFDELYKAMSDSKRYYTYDPKNPNHVELYLVRADIQDDVVPVTKNVLKLNNQSINITKRDDLKLYTYLAKLTRKLGEEYTASPEGLECTRMVNGAIHQEAMNYIDNVM